VNLRPATVEDVPAVLALELDVFGVDAWSETSVREELTGPRRVAVVASDEDDRGAPAGPERLVGYAVTAASGDVVDLQRIVVHPEARRRGLARDLLAAVAQRSVGERMLLEVSAVNGPALAFYAAEGFTEVHRRPRYYRDGSDAVVLQRPLPDSP
jgi:[ribosomal protein S18]-alanine N-acetyltransferase